MVEGIFREQSNKEKNDFINLMDNSFNTDISIRNDIIGKFKLRNRHLLSNEKNPTKAIEKLSCTGCFKAEHKNNLTSNNFKENYLKYAGRKVFDKIAFYQHKHKYGDDKDFAIVIRFLPCEYCGMIEGISFADHELPESVFKDLKKMSTEVITKGFEDSVEEWHDGKETKEKDKK